MALLYADENFDYPIVEHLRQLGHDVLTVQEAGRAHTSDPQVLGDATAAGRAVVTFTASISIACIARAPVTPVSSPVRAMGTTRLWPGASMTLLLPRAPWLANACASSGRRENIPEQGPY